MRLQIRGLQPNTDYAIQVRAVNATSQSAWSRIFLVKTDKKNTLPSAPTGFAFAYAGASFIASWIKPTTNEDGSPFNDFAYFELEFTAPLYTAKYVRTIDTMYSLTYEDLKTVMGTPPPTQLTARVRTVDNTGNKSAWTNSITASAAAPNAPTNAVVEEAIESVKLSWTASTSEDVIKYRVYASTTAGFTPSGSNLVFDGLATTFTYTTSTFALHYFKIRAVSIMGLESADLNAQGTPVSPFGADTVAPSVPGGVTAALNRTGSVATATITWTFDATISTNTDIANFAIRWKKTSDTVYAVDYISKELRSATVPLPNPYADYEFAVAAVDATANYSAYSTPVTLTGSISGAPTGVTSITATTGLDSLQLDWSSYVAPGDVTYGGYYHVQIDKDNSFTAPDLLEYNTGNKFITISGLSPATVYYYRVQAVDSTGLAGAYSTTASAATTSIGTPSTSDGYPPQSSPVANVTSGLSYLYVTWNPITLNSNGGPQVDPVTYEVHLSTTNPFTPSVATKVTEVNGTFAVVDILPGTQTPLSYGTTYYIRLVAKDRDGSALPGTTGSGTLSRVASSDITTVNADIIAAGNGFITTLIMATGGSIRSANYVANTTGYALNTSGLDIRSGTISVGTLVGGTISSPDIRVGAGGLLTIDSTGAIQSNNYAASSTGWKLSSTGLEINNGSVSANLVTGGTFNAGTINVGSGGGIQGAGGGWSLSSTGLTVTNGTITGATVATNQLRSQTTSPYAPNGYTFSINSGGYAELAGAAIYGNTIVGWSSTNYIQSGNYSPGSAGWKITGDGNAEFMSATVQGIFRTGGSFSYPRVEVADSVRNFGTSSYQFGEASVDLWGHTSSIYAPARFRSAVGYTFLEGLQLNSSYPYTAVRLYPFSNGTSTIELYSTYINAQGYVQRQDGSQQIQTLGGMHLNSGTLSGVSNMTSDGNGIYFNIPSGQLRMTASSSMTGRLGTNNGTGACIVWQSGDIIVAGDAYNAVSATAANTRVLWCNRVQAYNTYVNNSDMRNKTSVDTITSAIDTLKKIEPKKYKWKTETRMWRDDGRYQHGVVAQELKNVLPEAVHDMGNGVLGVSYQDVFAVGLAATKELVYKNEELESRVAYLERLVAGLDK